MVNNGYFVGRRKKSAQRNNQPDILLSLQNLITLIYMKKLLKRGALEYEQPQITTLLFEAEQGFATSSMLDDMKETQGEWADY